MTPSSGSCSSNPALCCPCFQGVLPPLPPKRFFHASSDPSVVAQRREKLDTIVQVILRQCAKDAQVQVMTAAHPPSLLTCFFCDHCFCVQLFFLLGVEEEMRESSAALDADIMKVERQMFQELGPQAHPSIHCWLHGLTCACSLSLSSSQARFSLAIREEYVDFFDVEDHIKVGWESVRVYVCACVCVRALQRPFYRPPPPSTSLVHSSPINRSIQQIEYGASRPYI